MTNEDIQGITIYVTKERKRLDEILVLEVENTELVEHFIILTNEAAISQDLNSILNS